MFDLDIHCIHCDFRGIMDIPGAQLHVPVSMLFRRLGRNPYSGHLHYQCPACEIVHLINPEMVPDKKFVQALINGKQAGKRVSLYPQAAFAGVMP